MRAAQAAVALREPPPPFHPHPSLLPLGEKERTRLLFERARPYEADPNSLKNGAGDAERQLTPATASGQRTPGRRVLPEKLLAKLWRARAGRRMRTTDGRGVRVLYPGRPAPGHGPDFRDAVIEIEGRRVRGPVELHRTPADWDNHGHSQDTAYDGVMLHVVGNAAKGAGPELPTVEIADDGDGTENSERAGAPLHRLAALDDEALMSALRRAGMARFRERCKRVAGAVARQGVEQALYAAVMEALGYAENRAPFVELSRRLPAAVLRAAALAFPAERRPALLRDLLASASGLEPTLEAWLALDGSAPMERGAWRLAGVRPANHPLRRMEAAAQIMAWTLPMGLAPSLVEACLAGPEALIGTLRGHGDAPRASADSAGRGARLGEQRAREIAVNSVLPVMASWAREKKDRALLRACVGCYARFPALGENTVTREARRLLGERGARLRLGACEHQGLMHVYRRAVSC